MLPPGRPGRRSILWRPRKQDLDPLRDDVPQVRGLRARAAVVPHGYDILHEARHYDPLAAVLPGNWQTCRNKEWLYCEQGSQVYPTGFHSYATEKDADEALKLFRAGASWRDRSQWIVVPCLVKDVIAVGYDGSAGPETADLRNVVSKRIKVLLPRPPKN